MRQRIEILWDTSTDQVFLRLELIDSVQLVVHSKWFYVKSHRVKPEYLMEIMLKTIVHNRKWFFHFKKWFISKRNPLKMKKWSMPLCGSPITPLMHYCFCRLSCSWIRLIFVPEMDFSLKSSKNFLCHLKYHQSRRRNRLDGENCQNNAIYVCYIFIVGSKNIKEVNLLTAILCEKSSRVSRNE